MAGMTPDRAREIIDAYGADPARWPEGERIAALALIERSGELTAYLSVAQEVDALLNVRTSDEPSVELETLILASAPHSATSLRSTPTANGFGVMFRRLLAGGAAMACVSVGAVSGYAMTALSEDTPSVTERADAYLAAGFDGEYGDSWWESDG